jgi:hypothetical protein
MEIISASAMINQNRIRRAFAQRPFPIRITPFAGVANRRM